MYMELRTVRFSIFEKSFMQFSSTRRTSEEGKKETGEGAKLHATLFTTLLSLSRAEYDSFRMLNVDVTLGSLSKVV